MYWSPYIRTNLAFSLLVLLCLMMASNAVFIHKHQTASGGVITHIHPYNLATDPEDTKHHRSSGEIFTWDIAVQGNYLQPHYAQVDFSSSLTIKTEQPFKATYPLFLDFLGLADLRAPPW